MTRKVIEDEYNEADMFGGRSPQGGGSVLSRYYRIPGLHVRLPTEGAFLPEGAYNPTATGDVPVYPMRAADELLLKSPDALMSGYGIEKMLESCVPAITTPREIATPDLDVLLLAIRAATYGDTMPITARCPKCSHESEFECNLPGMLSTLNKVPAENPVRLNDDIVVYLRPFNLGNATRVSSATFEEARKMQSIEDQSDEVRRDGINDSFQRLSDLGVEMTADCVVRVVVPEGPVTDRKDIAGFVTNIPRKWYNKLEKKLKELNQMGMDKTIEVCCEECKHEWKTEVEFDPSSFFAFGS